MSPHLEVAKWKEARAAYPGWLVLPERNRNNLRHEIRGHSHDDLTNSLIYGRLSDWLPEDLLDSWAELNWRLERVLFPLRPEWIPQIEDLLAKIAPLPDLTKAGEGFFTAEATAFHRRSDLRQPWIELAIAVLRHHREFRRRAEFFAWRDRLAPLEADWDIILHQRAYQLALWHLTLMDDAAALTGLQTWTAERGSDPYWLARKAGLLAELGEAEGAKALWQDAVHHLQGVRANGRPFYATSREGAIQSLHLQLPFRPSNRRDIDDRLRVLSSIDGLVPWDVIAALTHPDVEYREKLDEMERNPRGHYFFGGPWRPEAAVQCFRLCEELGFPLRGYDPFPISLSINAALRDSFADLALASDDLAGTSFLRLRDTEFWEKLDNAQIAAIPEPFWNDLNTSCENAWRQIEQSTSLLCPVGESLIKRACGLLRIIHWRIEAAERKAWVVRILAFVEKNPAGRLFRNAKALSDLLPDLTINLLPSQVSEMLGDLLRFPLPEECGVEQRFWPSPFSPLRAPLPKPAMAPAMRRRIERMVDMVPASKEAIVRLAWLAGLGLLPDKVGPRLANNLWGDGNQIPNVYPAYPSALLQLPELHPGQAEQVFKRRFLDTPIPDLCERKDGKVSIGFGGSDWSSDLHHISRPYRWAERRFIDWTAEEAGILFRHIGDWWDREGRDLLSSERPFSDIASHQRFYHLNFCLARAIAPALAMDSESGRTRLPRLLDELEQAGHPTLSVLPLLLRFQTIDVGTVESRLIDGVGANDEDLATDATWGIIHWTEFRQIAGLPAPPPRLIERLVMFIATRSSDPLIPELVGTIEAILAHDLDILSDRARELLEIALDALQARAAYPQTWHQRAQGRQANIVDLRCNAVRLASAMARAKISDHDAIRDWLEIGRTDPLWAVRMALREEEAS